MSSSFPHNLSRRTLLAAMVGVAASGVACRSRGAVATSAVPQRIVSLTPNTTEAVFALGAGARMVGRSRFCDFPPEALRLPAVGGYVDPSFEAILALRPDLVIGARGPSGRDMVDRLEARGVRTWFPVTETLAEIDQMILGLGDLLALPSEGKRVVDEIRARLQRIDSQLAGKHRPRALLVFGMAPVVTAGPGCFPDEMLRHAGMTNAMATGSKYPTINIEAVLALDPDLVIDAAVAEGHGKTRISADQPGWGSLRAVREGRIAAVQDDSVLRPGPRVAAGVAILAAIAHPEADLR